MTAGDANRSYLVAEPPQGAPVLAVVMSLHGTRSTAARQALLSGFEQLAQTASAVVVFPEAIERVGTGYKWDPGRAPQPTSDASWSRAPHWDVRRCSDVEPFRQRSPGARPGGGCGGRAALAERPGAPRAWAQANGITAPAEVAVSPTLTRTTYGAEGQLGVRATPRRRSVTAVSRSDRRRRGGDLRRHRRQRLRPRRSWLLTQCPARTAEVRETSPASTVAAQISASLRTLPLP
jgi:hypothetical protein